jgi:hypothetical protein
MSYIYYIYNYIYSLKLTFKIERYHLYTTYQACITTYISYIYIATLLLYSFLGWGSYSMPAQTHVQESWRYVPCHCLTRGCNGKRVVKPTFAKHQRADQQAADRRAQRREAARARTINLPSIDDVEEAVDQNIPDHEQAPNQDDGHNEIDLEGETDYIANNPIIFMIYLVGTSLLRQTAKEHWLKRCSGFWIYQLNRK